MKAFRNIVMFTLMPIIFVLVFSIILFGGGGSSGPAAGQPVITPVTPEKATEYGKMCSEMGVPWDIVLLTDAFFAEQEGKKDIEDVNPVYTALEFLVLEEIREDYVIVDVDIDEETGDVDYDYDWEYAATTKYTAKDEILDYINLSGDPANFSPSKLISMAEEVAEDKSNSDERYEVNFKVNSDFEAILSAEIGLDEENISKIIELYENKYIPILYFGKSMYAFGTYDLPEVTIGDVTRMELLEVAASIIGHPYGSGSKTFTVGPPDGPLDCSGFVDWVYVQCFNKTASGGFIPENINVSGTAYQYYASRPIEESELKIGDLAFYDTPENVTILDEVNHVGIYVGKIDGRNAFIHCGGEWFGYEPGRETGRVGISINAWGVQNDYDNINDQYFSPPMKSTNFQYFRRPQFIFKDDIENDETENDDESTNDVD